MDALLSDDEGWRVWREGVTMVLYLSVVLLATLAALPAVHEDIDGWMRSLSSLELVEILWGTSIGLALAHLFAFHVATQGVGGGALHGQDLREALAQLGGAAAVAAIATVPVLVFDHQTEQTVLPFVLAGVIGTSDYLVERAGGRSRTRSFVFAGITLLVALCIATLKFALTRH